MVNTTDSGAKWSINIDKKIWVIPNEEQLAYKIKEAEYVCLYPAGNVSGSPSAHDTRL